MTSARERIGRDLIRKTDGVWSTKQAAFDALDVALDVMMPGESAYREDVRRRPTYDKGAPRPTWAQLDYHAKVSWERDPTPREWTVPYTDVSTVTEYGLTQKLSNAVRVF